jgi:hypothetical protein
MHGIFYNQNDSHPILAFKMLKWVSESCLCTILHNSIAVLAFFMQHFQLFLFSQGHWRIEITVQSIQAVEALLDNPLLTLRGPVQYMAAGADNEQAWGTRACFFKCTADMLKC